MATINPAGAQIKRFGAAGSRRPPVYTLMAVLSSVITYFILDLAHCNLSVPMAYAAGGDTMTSIGIVKAMADDGWIDHISRLGAPFSSGYLDYPVLSLAHLTIERILVALTGNYAVAINVFFILMFPIGAILALWALRELGFGTIASVVPAILYSFLPYRFWRGTSHIYYASYYFVPLAIVLLVWLARREPLWKRDPGSIRLTRRGVISLAICLGIAWDNQYHVVFELYLLIFSGAFAFAARRKIVDLLPACISAMTIVLAFLVQAAPAMLFRLQHGANQDAFYRQPVEAELYALQISQLLMPISVHRIPGVGALTSYFNTIFPPLINENQSVALGIVGSIGFLALLLFPMFVSSRSDDKSISTLAAMNYAAIILATVGGLGTLFNYFISPDFRTYNRIAPFIAFDSLAMIACALFRVALVLFGVCGLLDETSPAYNPPYAASAAQYKIDHEFVSVIEASAKPNSAILELPFVAFPESPVVLNLDPFREFMPFLQSTTLRWSYGASYGRFGRNRCRHCLLISSSFGVALAATPAS